MLNFFLSLPSPSIYPDGHIQDRRARTSTKPLGPSYNGTLAVSDASCWKCLFVPVIEPPQAVTSHCFPLSHDENFQPALNSNDT